MQVKVSTGVSYVVQHCAAYAELTLVCIDVDFVLFTDACSVVKPSCLLNECAGGRPIDFVAAGITGVLSHHRSGFDAYHVVNPHWDDGVSLDAIVTWLSEEHGGVRRIQDYAQWCALPIMYLTPVWLGHISLDGSLHRRAQLVCSAAQGGACCAAAHV